MTGQIGRPDPLRLKRFPGGRFLFLPFVDQQVQAQLVAAEHVEIARNPLVFADDAFADFGEIGEIAG